MDLSHVPALVEALARPEDASALAHQTALLQSLYTTPGFYDALQRTALDGARPRDARILAGLVLKNELVSRWRAKSIVPETDKALIRERFLAFLGEPDAAIADTQFWVLSKLSRIDYPRLWPNLMTTLVDRLLASAGSYLQPLESTASSSSSSLLEMAGSSSGGGSPAAATAGAIELRNSLAAINRLVKEWTTIRLPVGAQTLGDWQGTLLPVLASLLDRLLTRRQQQQQQQQRANVEAAAAAAADDNDEGSTGGVGEEGGRRRRLDERYGGSEEATDGRLIGLTFKTLSRLAVWDWAQPHHRGRPRRAPLLTPLTSSSSRGVIAGGGGGGGGADANANDANANTNDDDDDDGGRSARASDVFGLVVRLLGEELAERDRRWERLQQLRSAAAAVAGMGAGRQQQQQLEQEETKGGAVALLLLLAESTAIVKGALKFLRRMQEASPGEFANLPEANAVVLHLWARTQAGLLRRAATLDAADDGAPTAEDGGGGSSSRLEDVQAGAVQWPVGFQLTTLLLIKDLLPSWEAKHQDVLTPSLIADLFQTLVSGALLLSADDLEQLTHEPEEWVVREGATNEQWTFELRPCGERVLLALNIACRNRDDRIMEVLMQTKLSEALSTPIMDARSLVRKEAVYTAAGRLVRSLVQNEAVPVQTLLSLLADECLRQGEEWRPLKRRIAWLIGELVEADDELAGSDGPWQPLLYLVTDRSASSDPGVRLTAAGALKSAMDLWELDPAVFAPYIPRIADGLMALIDELETLEGKRRVLGAVEVMVEREGVDIKPYVGGIASQVPDLWSKASNMEGEWLFKSSLLTLVTKLVTALGTEAQVLTTLCIELLGQSMTGHAKLQLDEDALVLWQTLLYNAPALDPRLAALVPAAIDGLANDRDMLTRAAGILDSYVLLDGARVYESFAGPICQALGDVLATSRPADAIEVLSSLALHVQLAPFELWAPAAVASGLVKRLIEGATSREVGTALPHYASLLARIILASPSSFLLLLAQAGVPLETFLDLWWAAFDRLALSSMRKRCALASAALCATGEPAVLSRFGELLNVFLDVLGELKETEADAAGDQAANIGSSLNLHWKRGADAPVAGDAEGTAEGERLQALHAQDPVFAASLKGFLRSHLANTANLGSYVDPSDPAFVELQRYLGS